MLTGAGLALALAMTGGPAAAQSDAHTHIGHVMTGWSDTPGGAGLLPTARSEATVAVQHAGYAAGDTGDLGSMRAHTAHVLHAIDPGVEPQGPGAGYGLRKAAQGVAAHLRGVFKIADAAKWGSAAFSPSHRPRYRQR